MADVLRFITCGSVDDGKSTLIGRLLFESKQVFDDHLAALEKDSPRYGTQGEAIDLALLLDGLQAEREQRITIDVAYRYFATARRRFVVADTPGHEQYTRNMATGASTADAAVLLVDARRGILLQTRRHSRIVAMLGVRHVIVAVNKMDLVERDETVFSDIAADYRAFADTLGFRTVQVIPVSALEGDNVTQPGTRMPWYAGPTLLACLETLEISDPRANLPFRMAVQWVNRAGQDFRGYCGRIASGVVKVGDPVCVLPAGTETRVKSIVVWQGERPSASAGESVTLCLADEIDASRGDLITTAHTPPDTSDQFEARVLCLSTQHLVAGRPYLLRLHTSQAIATITAIKHRVDVNHGSKLAARTLECNEIGVVNLSLDRALPFEPYDRVKSLGAFILIDRLTNQTVGAGMIDFALRRAANLHWQTLELDKAGRAALKLQKPLCIWLTGLPASGKSTIANLLEKRLHAEGRHTYLLDGDNVRHGLNRDLGFTEADRIENIRRVAEVSRLMVDAGLVVIVSFISPYRAEREYARSLFEPGEFCEVFVDTPLAECERRDPKGLYAKARSGALVNFTGIDSPYEAPQSPEVRVDGGADGAERCVDQVLARVNRLIG